MALLRGVSFDLTPFFYAIFLYLHIMKAIIQKIMIN
jgi:hypothetical protein